VIRVIQLMAHCNPVSVSTSFYGNRTISTTAFSGNVFRLTNDCNTAVSETVNWRHNTYFQKVGNTWTHDTMRAPATTLWAMEVTRSYFSGVHSYNGWDNGNSGWRSNEDALFCGGDGCIPSDPNNASYYRGYMWVGWGNSDALGDDWNSLDIIGHEFTHGISDTMAHLVYANESGALNESFSDIFGNTIQAHQLGSVANLWKMGEDRNSGGTSLYIRNMEDPNEKNDPDTYKGLKWHTTPDDNYGVHTNSGVQNFMYYLLANGGAGTNDKSWNYKVEGIGIIPARRIAFKALVDYMDANATHQTARSAWLSAALDLYGVNSAEYRQVANAWFAVGVCSNGGEEFI
ncbi:MAG: M4 family peptidase, partial [Pedobacter sp.]